MLTEYSGNLAEPLRSGHVLEIEGKTIANAKKFQIDLRSAKTAIDPNADIGLRLVCYFQDNFIHRIARYNNRWIKEIGISSCDGNPIEPGKVFKILLLLDNEKFNISINNRPYCTFQYRVPLHLLRTIEIRDDIEMVSQVDHRSVFPRPWPPLQVCRTGMKLTGYIPILFSPGHIIVISARCFGKQQQCVIRFTSTQCIRQELHFSIRYNEKVVVRNTCDSYYKFGTEERNGGFPFPFDKKFKLAIAITPQEFLFAVDGKRFVNFRYRTENILDEMSGVVMFSANGLQMEVTGVDHVKLEDPKCEGFEKYSELDFECP